MTKHQRQSLAFFAAFFGAVALEETAGRLALFFEAEAAAGRFRGVAAAAGLFKAGEGGSCVGNHQETLLIDMTTIHEKNIYIE